MAFKDYLTAEGERLLAKSIADSVPITFTRLVMGSGYLAQGTSEKNVAEVVTPVKTLDIKTVTLNDSTSTVVSAYFNNEGLDLGFYFREKAIYMQVGTEEVLAIYGNAGSSAEYIDTSDVLVIEKLIRTVLKLSSDELANVTLWDGTSAVAPIIMDVSLDKFVETDTALTISAGQALVLNKVVYYFAGGDQRDKGNYTSSMKLSDIYKSKIEGADEFGGIAASQNALHEAYSELSRDISETNKLTAEALELARAAREKAETAESIALGRNQSMTYTNYEAMITALNAMEADELQTAQNIYIGIVGVPDLWVYAVNTDKVEYTYESDDAVVSEIEENVYLQIGYYSVAFLETQKVDLTEINETIDTLQKTVAKLASMLNGFTLAYMTESEYNALATVDENTIYMRPKE